MAETPPAPQLRPHQRAAHDAVWSLWDAGQGRAAVIHPTGTGKTILGGAVARTAVDRGAGPVLFVVENLFLMEQWQGACARFGLSVAFEQGTQRAREGTYFGDRADCVVAMRQSLQGARLRGWKPGDAGRKHPGWPADYFGVVVNDEAHHWFSPGQQAIDRHFRPRHRLALTATPDRADGADLRSHYRVAHEYPTWEAIRDGMIKRVTIRKLPCDVDLRDIRTSRRDDGAEDLDPKELALRLAPHLETLCNAAADHLGDRSAICFTPDVLSARFAADAFRKVGVAAEWVSGDHPHKERVIREYRAGSFQVLCNADLTREAFDAPICSAIVLFRPTRSHGLMRQQIGRGFRLNGLYDDCLVLDPGCITGRNKLVHPAEVLDPAASAEVLARAVALIDDGTEGDVVAAVERAQAEADREDADRVAAREVAVPVARRAVSYRVIEYDPFPLLDPGGVGLLPRFAPERPDGSRPGPSPWHRQTLGAEFGFRPEAIDAMTGYAAGKLIGELKARQRRGLATWQQVTHLVEAGVAPEEARAMPRADAGWLVGGGRESA